MGLLFRSVAFATDFSASLSAGRYAALFAEHFDAELIVVHAFRLVAAAQEAEALQHSHSAQREQLESLLAETAQGLTPPAPRSTTVLGEGDPVEVIRDVSRRHEPSLIVLATHSGSAMERHILGSTAEEILRAIPGPILTVGPQVAAPPRLKLQRILYATDFTAAAAHAAPYAFELASAFRSAIDVLHVVASQDSVEKQALLDALDRLVPDDARQCCRPQGFVEVGDTRECIVRHATERGADLIVLGAHPHSHLAMHFRTGPAFQVIVQAPCPVLTICL